MKLDPKARYSAGDFQSPGPAAMGTASAMKSVFYATVAVVVCTAQAQTDNPVATAIGRDTDNLVVAAIAGNLATVKRLLASGADTNRRLMGTTAFEVALADGDVEMVQALLTAGADVPEDALFFAARARDLEMVKALLGTNADLDWQGEVNGNTALMYGISQHSRQNPAPMEIARLLVEAGADVNLANKTGVTALSLAVQGRSPENVAMVEALLARGARVDHRSCYYVPDGPLKNRSSYLRAVGATALGLASSMGNTAAVKALIAANANVNGPQCDGKTPLDLALENGHAEVADILRKAMVSAPSPN